MAPRIAIRCDGGGGIGAGHVARCRPIAVAFRDAGCETEIVGTLDGLAQWLVETTGLPIRDPGLGAPCGVDPTIYDGALVDLYGVAQAELCALAGTLPIATLGEAARCTEHGVLVDYHLDRDSVQNSARLLAGGDYAPVDPVFASLRRTAVADTVGCALVTLGGSNLVRRFAEPLITAVAGCLPGTRLVVTAGLPAPNGISVTRPPQPATLVGAAADADLAVTAAGMTAYELACAGVPFLAVVVVDNQARVGRALEKAGVALVLDLRDGVDDGALRETLGRLADPGLRRSLADAGPLAVDGRGAARVVDGLIGRWKLRV